MHLEMLEARIMFLSAHYVHSKAYRVRGKVSSFLVVMHGWFEGKWSNIRAEKPVVYSSNVLVWIFGGLRK